MPDEARVVEMGKAEYGRAPLPLGSCASAEAAKEANST